MVRVRDNTIEAGDKTVPGYIAIPVTDIPTAFSQAKINMIRLTALPVKDTCSEPKKQYEKKKLYFQFTLLY